MKNIIDLTQYLPQSVDVPSVPESGGAHRAAPNRPLTARIADLADAAASLLLGACLFTFLFFLLTH